MKQKSVWIEKRWAIRREAEKLLSSLSPVVETAEPADVMLHELLVHKVEFAMQIEELRHAHTAMEEARDRYADLYEFSPVGYITLNRECLITEINLTGAALLGMERAKLINNRFSAFVSPRDRDTWHRLFMHMMEPSEDANRAYVLEMMGADNSAFQAFLDCRPLKTMDSAQSLRLTVLDIGKIRQAEADMQTVSQAV
jgi:PAS domain S-box-containing protein